MMKIAQCLFPRAGDKEALVALSAVAVGVIGCVATLVVLVMMMTGQGERTSPQARIALCATCQFVAVFLIASP
jgi:hypothetical protein